MFSSDDGMKCVAKENNLIDLIDPYRLVAFLSTQNI